MRVKGCTDRLIECVNTFSSLNKYYFIASIKTNEVHQITNFSFGNRKESHMDPDLMNMVINQ